MNSNYVYSLQGCVSSLRSSVDVLGSALTSLDSGVSDLPRMKTVLKTKRVFEVVPESEVECVKSSIAGQVEPQIIELLQRAESAISKLERRQKGLVSKAELNEVRLQRQPKTSQVDDIKRLNESKQKLQRLRFTLSRLELVSEQKKRQMAKYL
ncbi:DASH complex subunit Spc19 [Lipomyces arxii]|uniref:DASH complex subunit Spc19 n=1 Tax=Lipomyces arxii TaxID=56418 RepID=UPI0034CD5297